MASILILSIALTSGLFVVWMFYPRKARRGVLAEAWSLDAARSLRELEPKSLDYKLAAAGLSLKPLSFRLLRAGAALLAFVIGLATLGPPVGLVAGGIGWYVPAAWLDERIQSRGQRIDRVLPIAVGRIAAGLLAGGTPADVLQQVADSLEVEGPNPLSPELALTAADMRAKDRIEALLDLGRRSPSTSLSNLATLLIGYLESGGSRYAETLMDISARVQSILGARNRAQAKAGDVMVSAWSMPAVLVGVLLYLSGDPLMRASLRAGLVQLILGAAMLVMLAGFFVLRSMVREAV